MNPADECEYRTPPPQDYQKYVVSTIWVGATIARCSDPHLNGAIIRTMIEGDQWR